MDTERWLLLKDIFNEAVALPPAERVAFLDTVCPSAAVRHEVEGLLDSLDDDPDFMEASVHEEALSLVAENNHLPDRSGTRMGPYRLVREIGHGGMGEVYLAERADGEFEQQVAIKLVRHGSRRADLHQRLRYERQILARLQHPNIARLLDGGLTEEGLPYLVMTYVEGQPITTYCDTHRLSTNQRLDLFRTVCDAVQYAHRNLVIHRDLKPSNILVASDGTVKLLDFGIAKLLDEESTEALPLTHTGMRVMTPEYASPEQVRGQPVTTATDVYALGIILYELLTGHRPYQVRDLSPTQVERVICQQQPQRPSTAVRHVDDKPTATTTRLAKTPAAISAARDTQPDRLYRRLRGDLDTVVLKALRKEPERRYASVEQLSEDLRRHLHQLPIVARPDTLGYRVTKLVQRHTMGVAATVLVALILLGGILATAYQARVAAAERDRAHARFNDVRVLANTLLFDLHDAVRELPGATPARQMLVGQALKYLDLLAQEAGDDPTLQLELAEAYQRVGEIQGDPHFPNLGDLTGATEQYRKALAIHEADWQRDTTNLVSQHHYAVSMGRLAVLLSWGSDNEQAIALSQRALDLLTPVIEADPTNDTAAFDAARIRSELGWWLVWAGRLDESLPHLEAAEPVLERLSEQNPRHLDIQIERWRVYAYQVDRASFGGDHQLGLDILTEKTLPFLEWMADIHPTNPRVQFCVRTGYSKLGSMLSSLDRPEEALTAHQTALAISQTLAAADTTNILSYAGEAGIHASIAGVLMDMGQIPEALAAYDESLALKEHIYALDTKSGEGANGLGITRRSYCELLLDIERPAQALPSCERAVAVFEDGVTSDPENAAWQENLSLAYVTTARVHRALAHTTSSTEHLNAAVTNFNLGLNLRAQLEQSGVRFAWSINPDSVEAERDALLGSN